MKPIIGETSYKDMTSEDIDRFLAEAQKMRSAAIHGMIKSGARSVVAVFRLPFKKAKAAKVSISRNDMVGAQ